MSKNECILAMDDELKDYQRDALDRQMAIKESDLRKLSTFRMPDEWRLALTLIHLRRGFQEMDGEMLHMMGTVGTSKSESLLLLATEGKKVGVELLYKIETTLSDEAAIADVVKLILDHGVKNSKNEVDMILASGEPVVNLFSI